MSTDRLKSNTMSIEKRTVSSIRIIADVQEVD